ncbi:MAG TPA: c-type cytochrome [Gaiellaceae bacterium]|nr:c-type cytochrome [Gaiellaceae bacterium]
MRALRGALLVALILAFATGCGTGGPAEGGDANQGRKLFQTTGQCGSCHTMKDAGSSGQIGPNLDEAFQRSREEGFEQSAIKNVVLDQIRFPTTGSGMPADLVEGDDAVDVAAYVAKCAGADPNNEQDRLACQNLVTKPGGEGLYSSLGCQGCHSIDGSASSGPTFKGLFNSMVELTNGQKVKADEAYLLDSILDPDKQIVKGYQPGVMTSAVPKDSVPQDQAQELVDYIKTLR